MPLSFILMLGATALFAFLAFDARRAFHRRLISILPRKVMSRHFETLVSEYPEHHRAFRRSVLPFSALQVAFNSIACGSFLLALWLFPPTMRSPLDLDILRYMSMVIVPVALLFDLVLLARLFISTSARRRIGATSE